MDSTELRRIFETFLPKDLIYEYAKSLKVVQRERDFDPVQMIFALVLVGGTAEAGRLSAAIRDYSTYMGKDGARSGLYTKFNEKFLLLMQELTNRALQYVRNMPHHLPGILEGRSDWRVFDSTTVRLHPALSEKYPATGDYAALKVHVELSLGVENVVGWHITPARQHDSPELVIDESRRGTGLIVDLGYVSHALIRACVAHDVHLVIRLKDGWNIQLDDHVMASQLCEWEASDAVMACFDGMPLKAHLKEPLDVDVRMGGKKAPVQARLVNVKTSEGYRAYLTTVPRETHDAAAISLLYGLRWSIELQNKLAKTGCQLDEITAQKAASAEILVHASMLASMLANGVVHLEHLSQGAQGTAVVKLKSPPLHPMLVWKGIVSAAWRVTSYLTEGQATDDDWARLANSLRGIGKDPNWKNAPSPLDDAKGRNAEGVAFRYRPVRKSRSNSKRSTSHSLK